MNLPLPFPSGPAMGQSEAEYFVEVINEIIDTLGDDPTGSGYEIKRTAGIITIVFPDGSVVDFTEPKFVGHQASSGNTAGPTPPPIP